MSWNDDSWRDGYEDDPCDHDDYDFDLLAGRANCWRCGHAWSLTTEEMNRHMELESAYHEAMESENRRQWWRDLWDRVKSILPRRKRVLILDDDIPF